MQEKIKINIFGTSHSDAIGVCIEGIGFGEAVDVEKLQDFINRRKAVSAKYSTARQEPDQIIFERGIENGITTGGEIIAKIYNTNVRRGDYSSLKGCPRPSHADYAAYCKYGLDYDHSGGGVFSGRMTAPMCIAGGIALQILQRRGIEIGAYIASIGGVIGQSYKYKNITKEQVLAVRDNSFPLLSEDCKQAMMRQIEGAASVGDSCGGSIECCVFGVKAGSGEPILGCIESGIAKNIFAIPAVKGIEFGSGFDLCSMRGSAANDEFYYDEDGSVKTSTNHNGGINGGLANGMPITFRVGIKPVPSISAPQKTVNLITKENTEISIKGRHDSCIVPRAVPVVEAMTALALINVL